MPLALNVGRTLPSDGAAGALVGRAWRPEVEGPSVVAIRPEGVYDIAHAFPTMRDLCESDDPPAAAADAEGERIGDFGGILANTPEEPRDPRRPWFLAPIDLQAIKAAGVTFAVSLLERVIEEQARGDKERAVALRGEITALIGDDL